MRLPQMIDRTVGLALIAMAAVTAVAWLVVGVPERAIVASAFALAVAVALRLGPPAPPPAPPPYDDGDYP
jgi:hypothetical protein